MDEIFGAADMSNVDGLGVAAQQADKLDVETGELEPTKDTKL
jgi:hypothetical protein